MSTASGSPAGGPVGAEEEAGLRAYESRLLGPDHAAEHALARRAQRRAQKRWAAMSPNERAEARAALHEDQIETQASLAAEGPPSELGQWTSAPFRIPNFAIHSALLPTGKVLLWGYPPKVGATRANTGQAALWDPTKGTGETAFKSVPPPVIDPDGSGPQDSGPAPIYCSGQSLLPDGSLLATGGNLVWPDSDGYEHFAGIANAFTFDPWSETWTEQPKMRDGRWYPTQTLLGDGTTLVTSGYSDDRPGEVVNREVEVFDAPMSLGGEGAFSHRQSADRLMALYPHLFVMPDGDVLLAGPNKHDSSDSAILDTESFTWRNLPLPIADRAASGAVLVPGGPQGSSRVLQTGGFDYQVTNAEGYWPAHETSEGIDGAAASPSWSEGPSFNHGRSNHNLVLLPDGSMVAVGGGRGSNLTEGGYMVHADGRLRQAEVYDPDTGQWRLGPAQQEDRAYHSTALLLPDGRVLSAGDDMNPTESGTYSSFDTAEIYSPPYLFKGTRPQIVSAPSSVRWGDGFGVAAANSPISRAVLMAPAATTHGVDMHQRHIELQVTARLDQGVNVVAPPSENVAPPGFYMLFLLDSNGVPSVAHWVRLDSAAPDRPELLPPGPALLPRRLGPNVDVKPASKRQALRAKGRLAVEVVVDETASIDLAVALRPAASNSAVTERTTRLELGPGTSRVVIKFPRRTARKMGRKSQIVLGVDARNAAGDRTTWSRSVRLKH